MTALFAWPARASVDRVIPKDTIYSRGKVPAAIQRLFVQQVGQIRWAYKIGEDSVPLPATDEVAEFQVFELYLTCADVDRRVLAAIDGAVPSPIVFELRRDNGLWDDQAMTAAQKRNGARAVQLSPYFRSGWVRTGTERVPLPVALDLAGLHLHVLGALMPHPLRPGEALSAAVERMARIRAVEREIGALEKKMHAERQFNRKVELRQELASRHSALTTLTGDVTTAGAAATSATGDAATWTSST